MVCVTMINCSNRSEYVTRCIIRVNIVEVEIVKAFFIEIFLGFVCLAAGLVHLLVVCPPPPLFPSLSVRVCAC